MHLSCLILFDFCAITFLYVHTCMFFLFLSSYPGTASPLSLKIQSTMGPMLYASNVLLPCYLFLLSKIFLVLPFLHPFLDALLLLAGYILLILLCLFSSLHLVYSVESYFKHISLVLNPRCFQKFKLDSMKLKMYSPLLHEFMSF